MLESDVFSLLEHTTDAAFAVTEQGEILSWNKAAETLFGYPASEVLRKTCYKILEGMGPLGTRVCHDHCSVVECAGGKTDIPNFDMSVKTRSGERRWINMSTRVFDNRAPDGGCFYISHTTLWKKRKRKSSCTKCWNSPNS